MFLDVVNVAQAAYYSTNFAEAEKTPVGVTVETIHPIEQFWGFLKHKKDITKVTTETARQALKEGYRNNRNRTISKATIATVAGAWTVGEDVGWSAGTDRLYSEFGNSTPGKLAVAVGIAALFSAINIFATKLNIKTFESKQSMSSVENDTSISRLQRIKNSLGRFGTTMMIGPPTNAIRGGFTDNEVIAHSIGFGAVGTSLYIGANEGVNNLGPLNALDHWAVIPSITAGIVVARYARDICNDVASGAFKPNPQVAEQAS
ncbi:MAG TPA: hypothetical protein VJJ78_03705 [Candidatus Saccharimonadales bacterium]|nr:hypothetical protein [Candidatus Saccharimonadales bacterium]